MKTLKNHRIILSALVFFMMAACAYAYPPDNAAVLYYKAAAIYDVNDEMGDMLADLLKGRTSSNDRIREFVRKNHLIIDTLLDASEVKNCDWGMDFSQGLDMQLPQLARLRKLSYLVIADARILSEDGDYQAALNRCISLYKMVRHINDRILISYLVSIAINDLTNNCVNQILSEMPQDISSLTHLKNQLIEIDSIPFSIKPALLGELEAMLGAMVPEHMSDVVRLTVKDDSIKEKILSFDNAAIARNRNYFKDYFTNIIASFDMPYMEGYTKLKSLEQKTQNEAKSNPDATLTCILTPPIPKMFSHSIRFKTHNNAIKTAIELYIIKAKTGRLPDELPTGLPKDLFSGKDFEYKKTANGFTLRCQGKDFGKDETYEYEFKIRK